MTEEPIRVVIVDDHAIYRRGLRAAFEVDSTIQVIGECSTADDAVYVVPELRPDVTLMDLHMPRSAGEDETYCGVEAIRSIRRGWPEAVIVVLTMYRDFERVRDALRAGARGYLLKEDEGPDLVEELRLAAGGKGIFDRRVVDHLSVLVPAVGTSAHRPFPELTNRQCDILELVARGASNGEIAMRLFLSRKTVDNYLPVIYDRLQVRNRQEAIAKARAAGLGLPPDGSSSLETGVTAPSPREGGR